jgi:hypothetical protein
VALKGSAMKVFVVQHCHVQDDGEEDVKFIGAYSTKRRADAAVRRLLVQPGFRDAPDGFSVSTYEMDQDNWVEGYVTVKHAG